MVRLSNEFLVQFDFSRFEDEVRNQWRFAHSPIVEQLLKSVEETIPHRVLSVATHEILWRAQLGCEWPKDLKGGWEGDSIPTPYETKRMKPRQKPYGAAEGRVNPKGIPCLYLATKKETAMCEVRPWPGSYVTVAQFEVLRDLRIIDCARHSDQQINYLSPPASADDRTAQIWMQIDKAFSKPTTNVDNTAEYASTQILAELFRRCGYDGLAYKSNFWDGYNIALFDLDAAACQKPQLFQATNACFKFEEYECPGGYP